ncbi:MAG: hypothetical protein ACLT5H_09650 [Collinsella stercoris]|uniref:hypothetical protein n=1 Tax=Collinsella stercoris TaxID=147206 RepID=UPI003993022F
MLKVPTYNTRVTITSCLKSEKYGDYYERLKDDPSISPVVLEKYRALSRQEVSATFVVRGTTGEDVQMPASHSPFPRVWWACSRPTRAYGVKRGFL